MKRLLLLASVVGLAASLCAGDTFYVNRDTGVNSGDPYDNQGARSAVRSAKWGADESYLFDFDTAAILSFMGSSPISDFTFELFIMPSGGWPVSPASVSVETVNTNVDWAEGDDPNRFNSFGWTEGTPAATAEYCQTYYTTPGPVLDPVNSITWQRENGTPESEFKYLPANFTNSAALIGSSADHGSYISVLLDQNVVNDLLNNAKNRGLRLYRNAGDNMENYTREAASGNRPYLEVIYTGGGTGPDINFYQDVSSRGEEITTVKLLVSLSETSGSTVTVDYQATGGTAQGGGVDYTLAPGTLTFPPGELRQDIVIAINDDGSEEGDETIVVTLSNPTNGQLGTTTSHTFTIHDDDRVGTTWNVSTIGQLENATRNVQPGDEIVIAAGTYNLDAYLQINVHHILVRGATGNRDDVILNGPGMNVNAEPKEGLVIRGDSVTVMDLTVRSIYNNGIHLCGEYDLDDTWITNVKTLNVGERHIKGSHGSEISEGMVIENVYMLQTEARQSRPGHPVDPDNYIGGIDCMGTKEWLVRDNVAEGIVGATNGGRGAIFLWNGIETPVIERNQIFDCATGITIGNPSGPSNSHLDPWHSEGGVIRNNMIVRGSYIALELCNTKDTKVYNNTIYSADAGYFRTLHIYDEPGEGQTTNLDIVNNVVRGNVLDNSSGDWSVAAIEAMGNI
ncbi:MAG: Calx-beta domain-containing protein, partial [Planctomycetota bacterium]